MGEGRSAKSDRKRFRSAPATFVRRRAGGGFAVDRRHVAPESQFATALLIRALVARAHLVRGRVLDLGCGTKPYREMFAGRDGAGEGHIGTDLPHCRHGVNAVDAFAPADRLPFAGGAFDTVLCTEVLEHVPDPRAVMSEIARILKPGGVAIVTTPFLYRVHEAPFDFYRYTPFGLRALADSAGLTVEEIAPRGGFFSVMFDLKLKAAAMAIGAAGGLLHRITGLGRGIRTHAFTRWMFSLVETPMAALMAGERVKSEEFSLGFVTVMRRPPV